MSGVTNLSIPETPDLAFVAEWLAQQFLAPPEKAQVQEMRGIRGQAALCWIGGVLDQQKAAQAICLELSPGTTDEITVTLQRRYTALFEGIFRQRGAPPYASMWDGTGRLFGPAVERMQHLLRDLDVHMAADCTEPADHVAVQLAALAEALRQNRVETIRTLHSEMHGWIGRFTDALIAAEGSSFYGNAARFLSALVEKIAPDRFVAVDRDIAATAARI
jgi:TorA-specific chaperone